MNVGMVLVHIDCPTRNADTPSPPKLQLMGRDGLLYGRCPACDQWVSVAIAPAGPLSLRGDEVGPTADVHPLETVAPR